MIGKSFFLLEVVEVHVASRWVRISSPLLRPNRSKMLCDGLRASSVISLSCDLTIASGVVVRPNTVIFWGREGPASSCFLLTVVAEQVDSDCDRETYYEFTRWVEVVLPRVVALATWCSTRGHSTADQSLGVSWAGGITILSNTCLMVQTAWFVSILYPLCPLLLYCQ